jgi:uncharacterized small protein (DUF1192 family)
MNSKKRKFLFVASVIIGAGLLVVSLGDDSTVEAKNAYGKGSVSRLRHRVAALAEEIAWLKRALRAEMQKRMAADAALQAQIDVLRERCCETPSDPCDLSGIDFGPCDAVLGWGGIDGECQEISGCVSPVPLFASREECLKECHCRDFADIDFGPCEALLGYAIIDDECTAISGCPPSPVPLFRSLAECRAVCARRCGGIAGLTCPDDLVCIDDPADDCDPACGGADCGGICVRTDPNMSFCGGIASLPCPEGFSCVDDPRDLCSPQCGGADCSGICVAN